MRIVSQLSLLASANNFYLNVDTHFRKLFSRQMCSFGWYLGWLCKEYELDVMLTGIMYECLQLTVLPVCPAFDVDEPANPFVIQ